MTRVDPDATSQRERVALWLAIGAPAALLGGAYIAQYGFGLYPCEMCWWQRWPHFAALALGALAALIARWRRALVALAALGIAVSGAIGLFHAGVEYGWWPGLTSCTADLADASADPLEAIMNAPLQRCDVAPFTLLGISLAGFNFLFSSLAAIAIWIALKQGSAR